MQETSSGYEPKGKVLVGGMRARHEVKADKVPKFKPMSGGSIRPSWVRAPSATGAGEELRR